MKKSRIYYAAVISFCATLVIGFSFLITPQAQAQQGPTFGVIAPCPSCDSPAQPSISPSNSSYGSTVSQTPQVDPCVSAESAIAGEKKKDKKSKHKKHDGAISGLMEEFLKALVELLELLLKLIGGGNTQMPNNSTPIDQTPVDQDPIEQPPVDQDPISQAPVDQDPADQDPISQAPPPASVNPCPSPASGQPNTVPPSGGPAVPVSSTPVSVSGAPAATATKRNIPIAPEGSLGQYNLSSKDYIMAFRFILDKPETIDRWYFAINGEGASCVGGRTGYGSGNGGMHHGRIVEVDQATGLPTATVLAEEKVNGCTAHQRSMTEFGIQKTHQAHFVQFAKPAAIQAGKMYAFLLSNADPSPGDGGSKGGGNHMSPNLNFAKLAEMGPHGKNTLDANTPGALYGYDPRETTMWTKDGGKTWLFGAQVGWYDTGGDKGKMWVVGYRSGGKNIPHGYTYMNWPSAKSGATVTYKNVPKAVTLTDAGGAGTSVGVVTVTNTSTGVSATTPSLGAGVPSGKLSKPVPVAAGESYTIKAAGSVEMGSATWWDKIFGLGSNYSTSDGLNMPGLFALPHPYY